MKIIVRSKSGALTLKEESVKDTEYKKLLLSAQKIIKQLSLPLGSWLVKILRNPEQAEIVSKNIMGVLTTAMKMIPQLAENQDDGENKAGEAFIEFIKQSLIQSGKPELADELQAMIDDDGLSVDSVEIVEPQTNKAELLKEKDKKKKETDRERKARLFPGYDSQKKISLGIMEEDEEPEESEEDESDLLYPPSDIEEIKKQFERFTR